ncbi:surface-associated interspersed protein (SURFIN) [Plasmodium gallinaceum]|uniref:Surface-associated interspersed protein (SURFIN) n=1 Tax=Plasmodium gallinaceum TaxID=5849 RepID=A0A1J1GU30_PLAGA|nr:surface-associated interspersed protein (SURFIN) [Plasmodium gallinaceum]CRG96020.1 surface-associated interspersed protein (SURFIN) [Plasmodium gallinaceum]
MRKNSTSKNARLLSQLEEIPCMSNETNAAENNANLSNDTIPFKTEIQTFMNDTYNEFEFYLQDDKIANSTEKCQKVSTYIDWRGMDYVNLLLSKKENYNISCLVEDWNKKQNSFETHILTETNSTCNIGKFHYCPILNKSNNCTSPYENKDLPIRTSLTYDQLNDGIYYINKSQIIDQRRTMFYNLTYDISNYYFDAYHKDRSELNCAKWSMYIYKRGKLFINMNNNEIHSEEIYRQDSINTWNTFSRDLETYTLDLTSNQCNMTELIHKIKGRESSNNPYDLAWVHSDNNINGSNLTSDVSTPLPDNFQSTNRISNVPYIVSATNSIDNNTGTFSSINNNRTTSTPINITLKPSTSDNKSELQAITATFSEVTTQSNFLTSGTTPGSVLHTTEPSVSTSSVSGDMSSASSNTYSSKDSSKHTISVEPLTSSATLLTNEYQLSPSVNIVGPNVHGTTSISVNQSSSNTNSYAISPTIVTPPSTYDSTSYLKNNDTHSPTITNNSTDTAFPTTSSEIEPSLTSSITSIPHKSTPSIIVPTPTIRTAPSVNDSTSPSDDITTPPTITVHPLTDNTTSMTNGSSSSPTTIFPLSTMSSIDSNSSSSSISITSMTKPILNSAVVSTNNLMYTAKDDTIHPTISSISSTDITRFSSISNSNSYTTLPTSLESIIFNTTNNATKSPTKNYITSLLVTSNPIAQNSQNTPASIIQDKVIAPLNMTHNSALKTNVNVDSSSMTVSNNSTTQNPLNNSTEVTPTVNPTGNILITIVPVGIFILGIIFFLILLCKYTFIGSWFRNRKSKKRKVRKKMKKISKEPLLMSLNDRDSETINSGKYSLLHNEKQIPVCEISFESERNLKHRHMNKSMECKEIYMESGEERVHEVVEDVSKHKNESLIEEKKLNKDDTKNEIEEDELNENRSRGKIKKEKLIKSGLKKNEVSVIGYIRNNTLKEEGTNEINVETKKSTYEKEIKNSEDKMSIMGEVCNCNTWADKQVIALLDCKKEERELIINEFLRICIEVFEKDEKTIYLEEDGINLLKKGEEENSTVVTEKNSSIPEKWKKEEWFINLKKEWKNEEEKLLEYLEEQEVEKVAVEGISNLMLDIKKKAWRKWLEKQREHSNEFKKQDWFMKLLEEYEKDRIYKNIMEEKIEKISVEKQEKEKNDEIDKYEMKKNLTKKMLIDIYMMILEECKKEELEREKDELFKTNTEELGIEGNLDELENILKKIEEERSWNSILEKKKEDMEKWKREKWFVELMLEWKGNEQKYIEELNKKMLEEKNEERKTNIALERQYIIWKKHWEDMRKKWIENDNKEEWFTKLIDEIESKDKEYEDEISKKNIEKKRENEKNRKSGESITVINRKVKEKVKKFEKTHLEDTDENINSIIKKKKLKWKTIIEMHMIVLEECKKEEWMLNRGKFLETCLEEFIDEDKGKYPKIMKNDLVTMSNGEEEISTIMIEKQKLLWKKWVERNKSMLKKWKKEEWFINLKKEWIQEQEKFKKITNESEIEDIEVGKNPMLEKQKKIWRQWLKKQRAWFIEHSEEKWFNDLLAEYEKEEECKEGITKRNKRKVNGIHENIEELQQEGNEEIEKCRKRKKLIQNVLIEIHMKVIEECKKEEVEREKDEFFKTIMKELRILENLDEEVNVLEKIEEERSWNSILEKKKEDMEKWKREKWFVELMLEWKGNEQKYIEELNKKISEKKDEERKTNIALERQYIIWKKHWEDMRKKWIENDNKEEWFTKLVVEIENKENEYKSEITKKSIDKKRENGERFNTIVKINRKGKEKVKIYEKTHLEDTDKNINSIIKKKKLKWKTIIEMHMIVLEECKKEEWMLNREKFLETCLEEFIDEDKEKYPKIIENDLAMIKEGEDDINTIMIEKQKLLWKKWVERNKSMLKKWKKEEWFINLKKEWIQEQEKFKEITNESEIKDIEVGKNPMLEKQKKIWRQWLKKQRAWFIEHNEEKWLNDLLAEYEKEEECKEGITKRNKKKVNGIHENIEELQQEGNEEIEKCSKKKKLTQKVLIEIHMMVLEECKNVEWEKEKDEFFKTIMKGLRMQENFDEEANILENIGEE